MQTSSRRSLLRHHHAGNDRRFITQPRLTHMSSTRWRGTMVRQRTCKSGLKRADLVSSQCLIRRFARLLSRAKARRMQKGHGEMIQRAKRQSEILPNLSCMATSLSLATSHHASPREISPTSADNISSRSKHYPQLEKWKKRMQLSAKSIYRSVMAGMSSNGSAALRTSLSENRMSKHLISTK